MALIPEVQSLQKASCEGHNCKIYLRVIEKTSLNEQTIWQKNPKEIIPRPSVTAIA